MMLLKISWRNLWRNKMRTVIIMTSIIIGVAAVLLADAIGEGMVRQMLDNQINTHITHIQIHKAGFNVNKTITAIVPDPEKVEKVLKESSFVKDFSRRVITYGLVSSERSSTEIALLGIEPEREKNVTTISRFIVRGKYLSRNRNEILISQKVAEKLEVGIGDKIIVVATDIKGAASSELFRVTGIYQSPSADFDRTFIYVSLKNAQDMLGLGNNVSEFAVVTKDESQTYVYKDQLAKKLGDVYEILTFQELLPLTMSYLDMYKSTIKMLYVIIVIAVPFAIINTMLMSVFERVHEFGVLMSLGMKINRLFLMVIGEAFILGTAGTLAGVILGIIIYIPLSMFGIDFNMFTDSMTYLGFGSIIYPIVDFNVIINSLLIVPVATVIGAMYPALKAIRLHPADAMKV